MSNRLRDVGDCGPRPATAAEVVPALRLVLARDGRPADADQATEFMRFTAARGVSLTNVWVTTDAAGAHVRWAAVPMVSPGRTMLLFAAPLAVSDADAMAAGADAVCRHHGAAGVQLAQVLLDPADTAAAAVYQTVGFRPIAELLYMQKGIRRSARVPPTPPGLLLVPYDESVHNDFAAAILASYEDSMDCPPLNGVRAIADVIDGHKSAGAFDPADWFVLVDPAAGGPPVGVLLLSRTTAGDGMELVYVGLTPAARGRGLGGYLVKVAEGRSAAARVKHLSLAVDAANGPAIGLYQRHGFQRLAAKAALMRVLSGA